jgi:probable phosphoglycerate mutase
LIRHGKTDWNALGKIQGQTDTLLNEEGLRQAKALAERLYRDADEKWDAIVSSDLSRARETARIIAERLQLPLLPSDARLRERGFGEIEGTTEDERLQRWGADWRNAAVGQESDDSVRERGMSFVNEWRENRSEVRLLAVTHGSTLAQLLAEMCERLDDGYLGNMSYSILEYQDSRWNYLLHNCTRHLQPDETPAQAGDIVSR